MATIPAATPETPLRPANRKPWVRWSAVLLCVVGWLLSVYLLMLTGGAKAAPWMEIFCASDAGGGSAFDCNSVLRSRHAFVGGQANADGGAQQSVGIPWGAFGAAYFGFVGLWFLFVGPASRNRFGWQVLIAAVVLIGCVISLYLIGVMGVELRRWCSGCLMVHGVNGAILVLTLLAFPWRKPVAPQKPHPPTALALATLCAGFFFAQLHFFFTAAAMASSNFREVYRRYTEIVDDPAFARWHYERSPVRELPLRDGDVISGPPDAPHTVVVFVDFQCTACRLARDMLSELLERYPEQLRVVYRHFPLDRSCNASQPRSPHPAACRATRAVEAARVAGGAAGFKAMRDLCYARLSRLDAADFSAWAAELGLDAAAFRAALDASAVSERIQADITLGNELGVNGVPVLFLDGRRLEHWRNAKTWEALLGVANDKLTTQEAAP
ncbi:MAG: DsbA family protein [Phycisphaerae bacterium]